MKIEVSVIISTLGGPELESTISQLNQGTLIPAEILVCVPEANVADIGLLSFENVRVVPTPCRGQVAQRLYGFSQAKSTLVMQCDDDVYHDERCLELMSALIMEKGKRAVVGPSLFIRKTGKYAYDLNPLPDARPSLIHRILNGNEGFRSGTISRSGFNFAILRGEAPSSEVDWLPGGCLMHWKENLVKEDYYPFAGKAYAEDLFHSFVLRQAGMSLFVCRDAKCYFDWSATGKTERSRQLRGEIRAMLRFAQFAGKERYRLVIYYSLVYAGQVVHAVRTLLAKFKQVVQSRKEQVR